MKWKKLLESEMEYAYMIVEKLMNLLEESDLDWKPSTGSNWMTTGQLLLHITESCGMCFQGFVTGDWGMPEEAEVNTDEMLPTAEKMKTVGSLKEAIDLLKKDRDIAREMLAITTEEDLENKEAPAPWDPSKVNLGQRLLQMIGHLHSHRSQLFYYLKLQGKPVHTGHLWGM